MNRRARRASLSRSEKFQYVRCEIDSDGRLIVLEDCGVHKRGSKEALSLYEVEGDASMGMTGLLGSEMDELLGFMNSQAKKGGHIVVMAAGESAKPGDVVKLGESEPNLGLVDFTQGTH